MRRTLSAIYPALTLLVFLLTGSRANAQVDMTHIKTNGYDAYAVSVVNATDSTFKLNLSVSADGNINVNDLIFNQIDSIMYSHYGDAYDDKAKEELHKKMIKDMKKQNKGTDRKTKKFQRKVKRAFRKKAKK